MPNVFSRVRTIGPYLPLTPLNSLKKTLPLTPLKIKLNKQK